MTQSSTHGFHIKLNDILGSLSIQWLYLHDTNSASSMHCPLSPGGFIHPLHVPHSAQSNTQTPEEKGKIWVSGPLSYNKSCCVHLSPSTQIQPHFCNGLAQVSSSPSETTLTTCPALSSPTGSLLSRHSPALQPEVSSQNAYLPMSHPCSQSTVFQWPVWSALPTSPDTGCPLSPRHLLTILQTKHTLSKTCHLSVHDVLFLLVYLLNLITLWL